MITSCKEIPVVISDPEIPSSDRVVLVEELTGASCSNCPKGTSALESILAVYPERVLVIGIHGEFLSEPTKYSQFDFRNSTAKALETWFQPWFGKPSATVNRVSDEFGFLMNPLPDLWLSMVEKELQKEHELNLAMQVNYDETNRRITAEISAIPLVDLSGNYNISVYILESGIIDAQASGAEIIKEYEFNHVLRDMITNFSGDVLGSNLKANQIIRKTYTYTLTEEQSTQWNVDKMAIATMISHADPNNKEVLQAQEVYLKQ